MFKTASNNTAPSPGYDFYIVLKICAGVGGKLKKSKKVDVKNVDIKKVEVLKCT